MPASEVFQTIERDMRVCADGNISLSIRESVSFESQHDNNAVLISVRRNYAQRKQKCHGFIVLHMSAISKKKPSEPTCSIRVRFQPTAGNFLLDTYYTGGIMFSLNHQSNS